MVENPFRPGAGQQPMHLAGRSNEEERFKKLTGQNPVLRNVIITGLRGVGKTVLLERFKPVARKAGWLWTGTDLSESASLTEDRISLRLVTDLSILLRPIFVMQRERVQFGFTKDAGKTKTPIEFNDLWEIYKTTPGLVDDKIKAILRGVRDMLTGTGIRGVVFAYDEAQNLSDQARRDEYPLSVLLDAFASIQRDRHEIQFLLVLTGLPTLFPKLNEARTYSERMFDVLHIDRLSDSDTREAIEKPIELSNSPLVFSDEAVDDISEMSGGYPYFIQYMCKEIFDSWIAKEEKGEIPVVARDDIIAKLDQDFFAARWDRITDRQQEFMGVIATLETAGTGFTTQEIVAASRRLPGKAFSPSHATQVLKALSEIGLIYRHRHGKYSFAVPLMEAFISRQKIAGING